ncbi:hypothetical protein [Paraburkholderia sp. J10-1]|uniref:hypothetical protein n=1 Tax=Paraburkholderia sp. J10-1 TaxID=2805430 RepID=UPI002AB6798F|nr:hypothetical protein [Paraburkholderia sp. J10-1]
MGVMQVGLASRWSPADAAALARFVDGGEIQPAAFKYFSGRSRSAIRKKARAMGLLTEEAARDRVLRLMRDRQVRVAADVAKALKLEHDAAVSILRVLSRTGRNQQVHVVGLLERRVAYMIGPGEHCRDDIEIKDGCMKKRFRHADEVAAAVARADSVVFRAFHAMVSVGLVSA